ncbi:hypothetical protein ACTXT7_012510 [Hymenolepis weldensis]
MEQRFKNYYSLCFPSNSFGFLLCFLRSPEEYDIWLEQDNYTWTNSQPEICVAFTYLKAGKRLNDNSLCISRITFICILYDNTSVFHPRRWRDVFYVRMTHNPYMPCLNAPIDFAPSCNYLVSSKKHICAHVLARPYPSDSYKAIFLSHKNNARMSVTSSYAYCSSSLFISTLPSLSLPLSLALVLVVASFISGLISSWCSVLQFYAISFVKVIASDK